MVATSPPLSNSQNLGKDQAFPALPPVAAPHFSHANVPYLVYSSGHIWHPVVPQWSVRVYSWSFAGNMRPGSNPSRHSSGSPNCRWEHMGGFPLSQGFMDLFGLDWTFTCYDAWGAIELHEKWMFFFFIKEVAWIIILKFRQGSKKIHFSNFLLRFLVLLISWRL